MYIPEFTCKKNGVPILRRNEIDAIAERIICDFDRSWVLPGKQVNIELLIEAYFGLTLDFQYLSNDGRYLGATVFNDTPKMVVYNPSKDEAEYIHAREGTILVDRRLVESRNSGRYRFTLAHELGHWVLHKKYFCYRTNRTSMFQFGTAMIQCRDINKRYTRTQSWDESKWMEWQADSFAASILMPKSSVEEYARKATPTDLLSFPQSVSRQYDVSRAAAYYRLLDLNIITKSGNS